MKTQFIRTTVIGLLAATALSATALAADKTKGTIVSQSGQTVVIRANGQDTNVTVSASTKIKGTTGALNARSDPYEVSDLMRGLSVEVTGDKVGDAIQASEISFKKTDLRTARQINAGLASTDTSVAKNSEGIAANADRIDNVGELVALDRANVYFATGSAELTPEGKQNLLAIAAKAKDITGYRLAVVGRADPTGNAAANQRLSEERAATVEDFLLKNAGVVPGRILPTAALGDSTIGDDPNPPTSNAEARRVTVTIAVSKSSSQAQAATPGAESASTGQAPR
jgi:outer membrane protein OmpA-like peptidoglycan-associated protein